MFFFIEHEELEKVHNDIWNVSSNSTEKFELPTYLQQNINKTKSYDDKARGFHGKAIHKADRKYTCLAVMLIFFFF